MNASDLEQLLRSLGVRGQAVAVLVPVALWVLHLARKRRRRARQARRRAEQAWVELDPQRDFTLDQKIDMHRRDNGRCRYCGVVVHFPKCSDEGCDDDFEADHVIAWSKGGPTTLDNGWTACRYDNRAKGDRDVVEYLRASIARGDALRGGRPVPVRCRR